MPNHLSIIGIIHTAISIFALFAAAFCLLRNGKIIPENKNGQLYSVLTILTCLTSFLVMKTGHLTGAHGLGVVVLLLLPIGIYAKSFRFLGGFAAYLQIIIMSMTLFLSCIPAIVETLTRLPISHPIATGPNDPILQKGLAILATTFVVGVIYQLFKLKSGKKSTQTPDAEVKLS
jgi:hypothetical protein